MATSRRKYQFLIEKWQLENVEKYLGPCQTYVMEFLRKNNERLKAVNYFHNKAPSYMFDRFQIAPLKITNIFKNDLMNKTWKNKIHFLKNISVKKCSPNKNC